MKVMVLFKKTWIYIALFFLFLFLISTELRAQEESDEPFVNQTIESLISQIPDPTVPDPIVYADTVILYSPFLPIIFDGKHLNILNHKLTPENPLTKPFLPPLRFATHRLFADANHENDINRDAYNYLIKNNLDDIKHTAADFSGKVEKIEEMPSNIFQFLFKIDNNWDNDKIAKPVRFHPKRRYWVYNGNHKIQLSQNYISENWYKGGMTNLNLINGHNVSFNYNKNKYQNNNYVEWKLNLYTNQNDTLRRYRIAEDLIRTYSNFGIQAFNNWYYSANLEIKTQLFNNFVENSDQMLASIFSPLYINAGIFGMRYQIEKKDPKIKGKKINFNTDISPLSIQYVTVLSKEVDPQRFGIQEGSRHLTNLGSTVNAKLEVYFNKYVSFTSRFYYFTSYKTITAESENTLNMPINRYFSTTFYLFVRYDDNKQLVSDPTWGYFQFNELLSFGFNYNW
jgi:hypothetical protein